MTVSFDKPKRKNTPNRRRKFLLMIVLPMGVLIVGFMALSPQIDAWLATDPFTPQCHFEEDRLFLTGEPATLASFNDGQYNTFNSRAYRPQRWSPDGRYYIHVKDADVRTIAVSTYDGTEVFSLSDPQLAYDSWFWSPNSRMLLYSTNTQAISQLRIFEIIDNTVEEVTLLDFAPTDFPGHQLILSSQNADHTNPTLGWSSDGRYIAFDYKSQMMLIDTGSRTLVVLDITVPMYPVPSWGSNTVFYFVDGQILKRYDISTNVMLDLTTIPREAPVRINMYGKTTLGIYHEDRKLSLYHIPTDRWIWVGSAEWLIGSNKIIYTQQKDIDSYDYLQLDLTTGQSTLLFENRIIFGFVIAPSGHYYLSTEFYLLDRYISSIDNNSSVQKINSDKSAKLSWFSHQGQDWLLAQETKANLVDGVYMTYVIHPETMSRCKIGLTDINLDLQPEMEHFDT